MSMNNRNEIAGLLAKTGHIVTQDLLKEAVEYNPDTGEFLWKSRPVHHFKSEHAMLAWNGRYAGSKCGCVAGSTAKGFYLTIKLQRTWFQAHRLAFLYMTGVLPSGQVDHIDGDGLNNAWSNLRDVTHAENARNVALSTRNRSGALGVSWCRASQRWLASIKVQGANKHLGSFTDKREAIAARRAAERANGFHPNHGKRKAAKHTQAGGVHV